jgi:hypothetical protein
VQVNVTFYYAFNNLGSKSNVLWLEMPLLNGISGGKRGKMNGKGRVFVFGVKICRLL